MRKFLLILAASAALFAATANADLPRVAGEPAWVNEKAAAGQSAARKVKLSNVAAADVAQVSFGPMAESRIYELRKNNARVVNKALQVGIHRDMREEGMVAQQPALRWQSLHDGGSAARFAVTSPGALAMRLGLNFKDIPAAAEVRFLGANDGDVSVVAVVFGEEIARLHREQPLYWTPVTEGESQTVEIYLPASAANQPRFTIDSVSHLIVAPWGKLSGAKIGESDLCERDVSCASQTTAFVNAKNAVARMLFTADCGTNGALATCVCTGTLLNDSNTSTQVPYFYSANHCISTQTEASTLTTFWFYESTSCGSGVLGTNNIQVAGGAALLYNDVAKDALLLRLNNAPPSGAYFSGWDAALITAGTNFTVIHHPSGDVKKVSLGQVLGFTDLDTGGNFITVGYTNATTEQGSSGSALLTIHSSGAYDLRGGLFAGPAGCTNTGNLNSADNRDYYSRFDQVYPSISQYLQAAAAQPDYSGAWYNASENGWGLSVVRGPSSGLYGIIMYHYDQSANPTWYWMSAGSFSGNTYSAPVTLYSGPFFGGPYNPALLTSPIVGSATINFTSATTATLSYSISGNTVNNKSITKLIF